jgi:hypothetical protein
MFVCWDVSLQLSAKLLNRFRTNFLYFIGASFPYILSSETAVTSFNMAALLI